MARQALSCGKAILKKLAEQMFVPGEGGHAVSDVARRKDSIFFSQSPGAAAIVGDRDHRDEIRDRPCRAVPLRLGDKFSEPAKHRREAGTTAERNNPGRAKSTL